MSIPPDDSSSDRAVRNGPSSTLAGRTYPPTTPYVVSAAKVDEFAAALAGDEHPGGPDQRLSPLVAPPTFAIVVAARAWESMFDDQELGLALERIVHGDQRFTVARPLRVGDEVTATLTIDRILQRGGADMITSSVAIATTAGEPVGTATATFVHTPAPVTDQPVTDQPVTDQPATAGPASAAPGESTQGVDQ